MDTYVHLADEAINHPLNGKNDEVLAMISAATLMIEEWARRAASTIQTTQAS